MTNLLTNSEDFQTLSEYFRRFSKSCFKARHIVFEHFWNSEDNQRLLSYRNTSKYISKDYEIITMVIFSLLKITCYFHVWRYHAYPRKLNFLDHWHLYMYDKNVYFLVCIGDRIAIWSRSRSFQRCPGQYAVWAKHFTLTTILYNKVLPQINPVLYHFMNYTSTSEYVKISTTSVPVSFK